MTNEPPELTCPNCKRTWQWGDQIVHADDCPDKDFS